MVIKYMSAVPQCTQSRTFLIIIVLRLPVLFCLCMGNDRKYRAAKYYNFFIFNFSKKFFHEVILCTILYNSCKFDQDLFIHIGDHRYRTKGFAIPLEPSPEPSALINPRPNNSNLRAESFAAADSNSVRNWHRIQAGIDSEKNWKDTSLTC